MKTFQLGLEAAELTAQVAGAAATQAKAVSAAVARTKAKAAADQKVAVSSAITETRAKETVKRKKAVATAVTKSKAKARLRRVASLLPFAGVAVAAAFERQDYIEWQEENPGKEFGDYACEVSSISAQVADEVLQDLPEAIRPSPDTLLGYLPECEVEPGLGTEVAAADSETPLAEGENDSTDKP